MMSPLMHICMQVFFGHVQGRINEIEPGDSLLLIRMILVRSKLNDRYLPPRWDIATRIKY